MTPKKVHLLDPYFADLGRTFCGQIGVTTAAEPAEATCKTCLRSHRKMAAHAKAETMARESLGRA